jgi:dihydroorotate dehydrogenase (NAD+) catalytic subunit
LSYQREVVIGKGEKAAKLPLPWTNASGFLATPPAIERFARYENGGSVGKTILWHENDGHETPVFVEGADGFFYNAIGLSGPGVDNYRDEMSGRYPLKNGKVFIVSVASKRSAGELGDLIERLGSVYDIVEVNVSCPNVGRQGMLAGQDPKLVAEYIKKAKQAAGGKPVVVKLTPNVDDIGVIAKAAADAGADGILGINTIVGKYINPHTGAPHLTNKTGGKSGPQILENGLRSVDRIAGIRDKHNYDFKIGGVGGIDVGMAYGAQDIKRYMDAGADFVQLGTTLFLDRPMEKRRSGVVTVQQVLEELKVELYEC